MVTIDDKQSVIHALDYRLRTSDSPLALSFVSEDGRAYVPWFSRLLGALTLLVDSEEEVVFGQLADDGQGAARGLLLTKALVAVIDVPNFADSETAATVRAHPRSSIKSVDVAIEHGIDAKGSRRYPWPGEIVLHVAYKDEERPVELRGPGLNPFRNDEPSEMWLLLRALREDLGGPLHTDP